jgi:hypothetical protein
LAEESPQKDAQTVIERTCRIVMDVRVRVREITPESVAEEFSPSDDLPWEWAERQGRLLRALLSDEETLNQYLLYVAKDDLSALLDSEHIVGPSGEELDDLLEGVYSGMADEDAQFFGEARGDGILYDNTRLVDRAFVTDWASARLIDIRSVGREGG